ncbi:hypothetical protein [Pseudomonas protegens]|nr:hypothetical protein [Pseudomonas protegens]
MGLKFHASPYWDAGLASIEAAFGEIFLGTDTGIRVRHGSVAAQ